jgi:hypothetical protein
MKKLYDIIKLYKGRYNCWRNRHLWGPKRRYSMYSFIEKCQRPDCNVAIIDSRELIKY